MFDAHAHTSKTVTDKAFVCSATTDEYSILKAYRYKAIGALPGICAAPDFSLMDKAAGEGFHIGEIGIDRRYPEYGQEEIFRTALEIARNHDRIAVIHIVRSYERTLRILKDMSIRRFLIHGFTGSRESAEEFIKAGGIISLPPRLARAKSFPSILSIPFVTETDMPAGADEEKALSEWNALLSEITGKDVEKRSERIMKEVLGE